MTYVKKNDLLWDSSAFIPNEEFDEGETVEEVGNEPKINTTTAKFSIMSIKEKQKEIEANKSKE